MIALYLLACGPASVVLDGDTTTGLADSADTAALEGDADADSDSDSDSDSDTSADTSADTAAPLEGVTAIAPADCTSPATFNGCNYGLTGNATGLAVACDVDWTIYLDHITLPDPLVGAGTMSLVVGWQTPHDTNTTLTCILYADQGAPMPFTLEIVPWP